MPKLPNVKGYANNVLKELRQTVNSYSETIDAQDRARTYPHDADANKQQGREYWGKVASYRSQQSKQELGQLAGAVFKATRYNSKGQKSKSK